ncbi:MAG: hypothetical protein HGB21_02140 [Nitrospirae bacterium]|nr:hypothetical protein [Nitrospirota bacterium]NTW65103.1 hypothetical protein [Nitrospirota bacterium]
MHANTLCGPSVRAEAQDILLSIFLIPCLPFSMMFIGLASVRFHHNEEPIARLQPQGYDHYTKHAVEGTFEAVPSAIPANPLAPKR